MWDSVPPPEAGIQAFVRWVNEWVPAIPECQPTWWLTPNPAFDGRTPMEVLEAGEREPLEQMVYQINAGVAT